MRGGYSRRACRWGESTVGGLTCYASSFMAIMLWRKINTGMVPGKTRMVEYNQERPKQPSGRREANTKPVGNFIISVNNEQHKERERDSSGETSDAGRLGTQGYVLPWNGTVENAVLQRRGDRGNFRRGRTRNAETVETAQGRPWNRGRFCGAPWNRGRAAVEQVSGWRQESGLELED